MTRLARLLCACGVFILFGIRCDASPGRTTVLISDLHFGAGRDDNGVWLASEDFRWPRALCGFLDSISVEGSNAVDLVLVGDSFELWQPPAKLGCAGKNDDYGCSVAEVEAITRHVVSAHREELEALGEFAARGDNALYVVPGNHDSALVLDSVWNIVKEQLSRQGGRVARPRDGVWISDDRTIVAEHGHQIGADPNGYGDEWPHRITKKFGESEYLRRSWGESFVQALFNREEAQFPIIDNLSPETAGVRHRISERGIGSALTDVARFIQFNLFETSLAQKGAVLGGGDPRGAPARPWSIAVGRQLGYRLFLGAMDAKDPFARRLAAGGGEWTALQNELNQRAQTMPEDEIRTLCDLLQARAAKDRCVTVQGSVIASVIPRQWILKAHIRRTRQREPKTAVFVYGHTHAFELPWVLAMAPDPSVTIVNTGAFQRLIDDRQFIETGATLSSVTYDQMRPCYSFVRIRQDQQGRKVELKAWYMDEDGTGEPIDPCDARCPRAGDGCPA